MIAAQESQVLVSTSYGKHLQLELANIAPKLAGYCRSISIVLGLFISAAPSEATSIASRSALHVQQKDVIASLASLRKSAFCCCLAFSFPAAYGAHKTEGDS